MVSSTSPSFKILKKIGTYCELPSAGALVLAVEAFLAERTKENEDWLRHIMIRTELIDDLSWWDRHKDLRNLERELRSRELIG